MWFHGGRRFLPPPEIAGLVKGLLTIGFHHKGLLLLTHIKLLILGGYVSGGRLTSHDSSLSENPAKGKPWSANWLRNNSDYSDVIFGIDQRSFQQRSELQEQQSYYTPGNEHDNGNTAIWRCISVSPIKIGDVPLTF